MMPLQEKEKAPEAMQELLVINNNQEYNNIVFCL